MLGTKLLCLNVHFSCEMNMSTVVEDIRNIIKSSVTSPMFVLLYPGHSTNDLNGSRGIVILLLS